MTTWAAILRQAIQRSLDQTHTMCPAIVAASDGSSTCSIKLVVQTDPEIPEIPGVPIVEPGGGGSFLHFPISVGDGGLAIFSERDFTGWLTSGQVGKPLLLATHGLYAVFVPGLRHSLQADDPNLGGLSGAVLGRNGGPYVNVRSSKVSVFATPEAPTIKPLCKSDKFEAWANALESALNTFGVPMTAVTPLRQGIATTKLEAE